jgi:hypothetical protein
VKLKLEMKKLGFFDRVLFILGLTLAGVIAFVLVVGVFVALLKMYFNLKQNELPAVTMRKDVSNTDQSKEPALLDHSE